jgi:hypothetical protein
MHNPAPRTPSIRPNSPHPPTHTHTQRAANLVQRGVALVGLQQFARARDCLLEPRRRQQRAHKLARGLLKGGVERQRGLAGLRVRVCACACACACV